MSSMQRFIKEFEKDYSETLTKHFLGLVSSGLEYHEPYGVLMFWHVIQDAWMDEQKLTDGIIRYDPLEDNESRVNRIYCTLYELDEPDENAEKLQKAQIVKRLKKAKIW